MDNATKFGEIRSLLHGEQNAKQWADVCKLLDVLDADFLNAAILPYIQDMGQLWPDTLRLVPAVWLKLALKGKLHPAIGVCRGINLYGFLPEAHEFSLLLMPELTRLLTYFKATTGFNANHAQQMVESCTWPGLRVLSFAGCRSLGWEGIMTLCKGDWPALETLDFNRCQSEQAHVEQMGRNPTITQCRHLHLARSVMTESPERQFWPNLTTLDLRYISWADTILGDWVNPETMPALTSLDLTGYKIGAESVDHICDNLSPQLHSLRLRLSGLGGVLFDRLNQARWPHLNMLDLTACTLRQESLEVLVDSPTFKDVETIYVSKNYPTPHLEQRFFDDPRFVVEENPMVF